MATFRSKFLAPLLFASVACAQASEMPASTAAVPGTERSAAAALGAEALAKAAQNIDHLLPARDSVGAQPKKFEWTPIPGAEGYAFLLVNEIDIEIWETTVQATTLDVPKELVLDSGTYYWAVGAFKGGHQVAYSGRAAFVVLK
jgi:hypothetical protein